MKRLAGWQPLPIHESDRCLFCDIAPCLVLLDANAPRRRFAMCDACVTACGLATPTARGLATPLERVSEQALRVAMQHERTSLNDSMGALRTENDDLLRENAVLRRKVEQLERKR